MSFLQVIRRSCSRETLVKARQLVENKAVYLLAEGDEMTFEVFSSKRQSYRVSLWEADEDWDCDCEERQPCSHILAAILAFSEGKTQKQVEESLGYRFTTSEKGLLFSRVVIKKAKEKPFIGSIFRNYKGKFHRIDQQIERRIFNEFNRVLSKDILFSIFKFLQEKKGIDIKLDGKPIEISSSTAESEKTD